MNLIISQERSLNKAEGLLHSFKSDCVLIVDELPAADKKLYIHLAAKILIIPEFDFEKIIDAVPDCSSVWCVSENLLSLTAQLDKHYGINNISASAAEILSDKLKFDNFCRQIGLEDFVPASIIPKTVDELLNFGDKKIIVKSNRGSGGSVLFPDDDQNNPLFEFRIWNNPAEFLTHLTEHEIVDAFFEINNQGLIKKGYNNCLGYFIIQEFCEPVVPGFVTTGFVRDGKVEISLLSKVTKAPDKFVQHKDMFENHASAAQLPRDSALHTIRPEEIESTTLNKIHHFLQTIIDALQIKTMFFSGPDFHIDSHNNIKVIDFNPRISGWLNSINKKLNYTLISDILDNKHNNFSSLEQEFFSGCIILHPGKIKKIDDISSIEEYLNEENVKLAPELIVPSLLNMQNKKFKLNTTLMAQNKQELRDQYLQVTQFLQSAIEYYPIT